MRQPCGGPFEAGKTWPQKTLCILVHGRVIEGEFSRGRREEEEEEEEKQEVKKEKTKKRNA
jgi:hypothetical protein